MNRKITSLLIIGTVVVGAGLYAFFDRNGNVGEQQSALNDVAKQCQFTDSQRAKVDDAIGGEVAAFRLIDKPMSVGHLSFADADGKPLKMSDFSGKTILLNLWATWCPPCREEMPWLDELNATQGGDDFEVVAVSIDLDSADKPKAFYADNNIASMQFYHDGSMGIFNTLKKEGVALGMPTTVLVDKTGCALGVLNGPAHWASPDAVKLIRAAIGS